MRLDYLMADPSEIFTADLSVEEQRTLLAAPTECTYFLAMNPGICVEVMEALALRNEGVRLNLAKNPSLIPELQDRFVDDPEESVRIYLAKNVNLLGHLQERLSFRDHWRSWEDLSENPSVKPTDRFSVEYLRRYEIQYYQAAATESRDPEAFKSLGSNWRDSIVDLREACDLVNR